MVIVCVSHSYYLINDELKNPERKLNDLNFHISDELIFLRANFAQKIRKSDKKTFVSGFGVIRETSSIEWITKILKSTYIHMLLTCCLTSNYRTTVALIVNTKFSHMCID